MMELTPIAETSIRRYQNAGYRDPDLDGFALSDMVHTLTHLRRSHEWEQANNPVFDRKDAAQCVDNRHVIGACFSNIEGTFNEYSEGDRSFPQEDVRFIFSAMHHLFSAVNDRGRSNRDLVMQAAAALELGELIPREELLSPRFELQLGQIAKRMGIVFSRAGGVPDEQRGSR